MKIDNPRTADQIIKDSLWPVGEYAFEITEAMDSVSQKTGNEMIVLYVTVFKSDGKRFSFKDYLLDAFPLKLRNCIDTCGLADRYNSGEINARDFVGKSGVLYLGQAEAKGDFPARNEIRNYLPGKTLERPDPSKEDVYNEDGDLIPF